MRRMLKTITGKLTDLKIRKKLIGVYILSVLIPITLVGAYFANKMRDILIQHTIAETCTSADKLQQRITELADTVLAISSRVIMDEGVKEIATKKYENNYAVIIDFYNSSIAREYIQYRNEIEEIRVYAENDTLLSSGSFINATDEIQNTQWYQQALNKKGKVTWVYLSDQADDSAQLCLTRRLTIANGIYAVLVISLRNSYFDALLRDETFETIISLNYGKVVASSDSNIEGKNLNLPGITESKYTVRGSVLQTEYQDEPSYIIANSFFPQKESDRFQIFIIAPLNEIVGEANRVQVFSFSLIGTSLVVSILLILIFTKFFTNRVNVLRKEMHRVVSGDFRLCDSIKGKDEIGELHDDLNKIIGSINTLINEVYKQKLQKEKLVSKQKEAEFKMLASQINPHFLYNTLEAVRMKAHCGGQQEIAAIIKMLGKSMRRILEAGNELVSLSSELDHVVCYLEIQKFRFRDKFEYEIKIPTDFDTERYAILPLLLQPLAENAFIHGIESSQKAGKILIQAETIDNLLKITVEDNGVGMENSQLDELRELMDKTETHSGGSIGLCNVNQRIRLYYGEKYGLHMESRIGLGTKVMVCLPMNRREENAETSDR